MESQINNQKPLLISYLTLRKSVGFLGISMPVILLLGTFVLGRCHQIQDSISDYYFTIMGNVFVGILCAVSLFLITYKGYDWKDNIACNLAGVFALGVAFFPTSQNKDISCSMLQLSDTGFRIYTHYISASLFFITLACISLFLFTKNAGEKSSRKILRNRFYRTCGVIIVLSILLIFLFNKITWLEINFEEFKPVFWLEWVALIAFGLSWIIKGEFILTDKP